MQEIIELIQRWSPDQAYGFEPAYPYDITDLEDAVGPPIPGAYRRFLETMGRKTGPLRVGMADFNIRNLIDCYPLPPWKPPPRYLEIAIDNNPVAPQSYYLDRDQPLGDDCPIVRFPYPEDENKFEKSISVIFPSMLEMLTYWTFLSIRVPMFKYFSTLESSVSQSQRTDPTDLKAIEMLAEYLKFSRSPLMRHSRMYERADAGILAARQALGGGVEAVMIGADNHVEHEKLLTLFEEHVGLVRVRKREGEA